jgi:hypothetical protein
MVCVTAVEEEAVTAVAKPPLTAAHDSSRVGQTILHVCMCVHEFREVLLACICRVAVWYKARAWGFLAFATHLLPPFVQRGWPMTRARTWSHAQ